MQTHLSLVTNALTSAQAGPLVDSIEPRVLTGEFSSKLALVTQAERELRAMGVRVLSVHWSEPVPSIQIERDPNVSLKPLIDVLGRLHFDVREGAYDVWAYFGGVVVRWSEVPTPTGPVISVPLSTQEH